jgi:uncharacterized protein YcnI
MKKHLTLKVSLALGAGALLAVALPLAASAHVEITPDTAAAGSHSDITLRVPNESDTATTTTVEVDIPADTPFASVSYLAVPGWDAELVRTTLPKPVTVANTTLTEAVTKVIWTAQPGSEIAASEIRLFTLTVGPVPDTGKIRLDAIQTYSDGKRVDWTGTNAEHPSPVLYVNDVPPVTDDADAVSVPATQPTAAVTGSSGDTLARGLGVGGLVVGAIGAVVAIVSLRRQAAS